MKGSTVLVIVNERLAVPRRHVPVGLRFLLVREAGIGPTQGMSLSQFCASQRFYQLLTVMLIGVPLSMSSAEVPRLKRADSFLGVHFDFHAGPDCTEIGKNTTREMIEDVIEKVQPDYLQIDCKGHRGLSSYPTKVGNPAPGFVGGDPLRLWRQVTAERGVALYMHYSGVWDSEAILQHPDWAAINADGKTNANATSFFGPYADRLLVPQLRELAGDYGVDGAWVDGECWASVPDYGAPALKAFRETTGIADVPRKPGDPHWFEFLQFNRDAFRRYLRDYIAEVKKTNPEIPALQQLGLHRPHARTSLRTGWISFRAITARRTASTRRAFRPGIWRGRASRGT